MDEDVVESGDIEPIQWRRDASTSATVRLCWSLGVGTFFAAISIVTAWRLYDLAAQTGGQSVVVAAIGALVVTILALAVAGNATGRLEALADRFSIATSERSLERAMDAALGTIAMGTVIGGLMAAGRIVVELDLLGELGAGPFTGLAASTLPVALVVLVLASFLSSVGTLDRADETLYLGDPDHAIDLELIEDVSVRQIGDAAIVGLTYAQPDNQYVAGPRRVVVPPAVATEIERTVDSKL